MVLVASVLCLVLQTANSETTDERSSGGDQYGVVSGKVTPQGIQAGILARTKEGWDQATDEDMPEMWNVRTAEDGNYQLRLPPGTYSIGAHAKGFLAQKREGLTVMAGQEIKNFDFELPLGGSISGTITSTPGDRVWVQIKKYEPWPEYSFCLPLYSPSPHQF